MAVAGVMFSAFQTANAADPIVDLQIVRLSRRCETPCSKRVWSAWLVAVRACRQPSPPAGQRLDSDRQAPPPTL